MRARPEGLIEGIAERGLLIGGDHVAATTGGAYPHHDPATGRLQAEVPLAGAAEVDQAVRSAVEAGPAWRALAPDRRAAILFRLADLLEAHAEESAVLGALENGSPVSVMQPALYTASWVRYYAGWVDKIEGAVAPTYANTGLDYVRYEPYGVVGVMPPWNGPMMGMGQKAAPALAAGNTVVAKPPEIAPFGAYRFAELALEAGLPPGVLNVVAGGPEAGEALVRHPEVGKVSFTGGRDTARRVIEASAATIKPLTLELGGKSANIVFPDADLDTVIPMAAMAGAVLLSGQGCALPTRLYLHQDIYDQGIERLLAVMHHAAVGDPLDPETQMGPVVTRRAQERILAVVDRAVAGGAGKLLTGGCPMEGDLADGFFVAPTLFGDVDHDSELAREEIFGPVLSVLRFADEDEVVEKANDSQFGLGAYVHTADLSRAYRLATRLDAGFVVANGAPGLSPTAPFGGFKQSGFGREGGRLGLDEYLRVKQILLGI
jgi:aldehyde dehydrogenase (NAD+)